MSSGIGSGSENGGRPQKEQSQDEQLLDIVGYIHIVSK